MKKAINIVLVPSKTVKDTIIEMHKNITNSWWEQILFIPHISILMGVVEDKKVPLLIDELKRIFQKQVFLQLKIDKLIKKQKDNWKYVYDLNIQKTREVEHMHKEIFNLIGFFSFEPQKEDFFDSQNLDNITLTWVKKYKEKQDFEKFRPHITLGVWKDIDINLNQELPFSCSQIWVYYMWNYCTCADEIAVIDI